MIFEVFMAEARVHGSNPSSDDWLLLTGGIFFRGLRRSEIADREKSDHPLIRFLN